MNKLKYTKDTLDAETYCLPFVKQWASDITGNKCWLDIIPIPNYEPSSLDSANKIYKFLQTRHVDVILDYGARKPAYIDFKGTYGVNGIEWYQKLTMTLYYRDKSEADTVHHKSYPFLSNAFPDNTQYILYASKLLMILIPKHSLNKVMTSNKYKSRFDPSNIEWKQDKSDKTGRQLIKNIVFDLDNKADMTLLAEAGALFYGLRGDKYVRLAPI